MNTVSSIKRPLPVRPIDGPRTTGTAAPRLAPQPRGTMRPLPLPDFDVADLAGAIRATAFLQLQERARMQQPLPVIEQV